ncbi:MAG: ATP-binding protein [Candidatus Nanoarchaeia archaeon]|jgi:hypothetical protein
MTVGRVVSGSAGSIMLRVKNDAKVDIGDILIIEEAGAKYYVKVVNISINSLLPGQFIDDIAGQKLEHDVDYKLFDDADRFYKTCEAKILKILTDRFYPARNIPGYFAKVRKARPEEFKFLESYDGIAIGNLRLGTRVMSEINVKIPAHKLINHHILISAATGKGKSNFAKVFIKGLLGVDNTSAVVFDPHNEYYGGKNIKGLRDIRSDRVLYFTPKPQNAPGSEQLIFHGEDLGAGDFMEVLGTTGAQNEAMTLASRTYGKKWLTEFLINQNSDEIYKDMKGKVQLITIVSLKRKLINALNIDLKTGKGLIFTLEERSGTSIFDKIKRGVNDGKVIIIDTSLVGDLAERLITTSIVRKLFKAYKVTKEEAPDKFSSLPELMILFEEAPRVLGKSVLEHGSNVFARIAREGRKFKVGLCAITQMPSLLPAEILSQMNTKVILGLPSPVDRQAIINSSAQNINDEASEIQILDQGEAIITSPFITFPLPVKVYDFDKIVSDAPSKELNIGLS